MSEVTARAEEAAAKALWETGREPNPLVRAWDLTKNERGRDATRRLANATIAAYTQALQGEGEPSDEEVERAAKVVAAGPMADREAVWAELDETLRRHALNKAREILRAALATPPNREALDAE